MEKNWAAINILIVEDDTALLKVLCIYFKKIGAIVSQASNGQEALKIIENDKIDIVLSDVQMPIMGGVELLKTIRLSRPVIPIVLLTTGQAELTKSDALHFGASGLIHKPFKLKMLCEEVEKLLID